MNRLALLHGTLLGAAIQGTPAYQDVDRVLQQMREAFARAEVWTGRLEIQSTDSSGQESSRWVKFWIDADRSRTRADLGAMNSPIPNRTLVTSPGRIEDYHRLRAEIGWVEPEAEAHFSLGECLASSALSDPFHLAFFGKLAQEADSYLAPEGDGEEHYEGVPCWRLLFSGNCDCIVRIDTRRCLPLTMEYTLGRERRPISVQVKSLVGISRKQAESQFQLDPGLDRAPLAEARRRWSQSPLEASDLWPALGALAPGFRAREPGGAAKTRTPGRSASLLVFDFARDAASLAALVTGLQSFQDRRPELPILVLLHPSDPEVDPSVDREAAARLLELQRKGGGRIRVWFSGSDEGEAFLVYRVYFCPAFFLLDSKGQIEQRGGNLDKLGETE